MGRLDPVRWDGLVRDRHARRRRLDQRRGERLVAARPAHHQTVLSGAREYEHLRDHVKTLAGDPHGLPVEVFQLDESEYLARARVVHNTVEIDPDAPTLSEVREMMEEVEAEMAAEQEEL